MGRRYYRRYGKSSTGLPFIFILIGMAVLYTYPVLIPIIIIVFAVKLISRQKKETTFETPTTKYNIDENNLPYEKKTSQITEAEMNFYKVLDEVNAGRFDIQRQVLLSTLVDTTSKSFTDYSTGRKFNPDRSRINRITIDFVLFNKEDLSPYLAIELDDATHQREDRMGRDQFVEDVLEGAGIRLIRVKNSYTYNPETLDMILNL